jgi:hypothetical protein
MLVREPGTKTGRIGTGALKSFQVYYPSYMKLLNQLANHTVVAARPIYYIQFASNSYHRRKVDMYAPLRELCRMSALYQLKRLKSSLLSSGACFSNVI